MNSDPNSFVLYEFQKKTMPVLLGWAVASMAVGGAWALSGRKWLRGFGLQFLAWGLIDGLIALFGLRSAQVNAQKYESGETGAAEMEKQARNFEKVVWVNAGLDVVYVVFGVWLTSRNEKNELRHGTGWGIAVQGAFLFVWDVVLALLLGRKRNVV